MALNKVPTLEQFSWQPSVEDKDLTAPPGSPSKGQRYIVGPSATGSWATHDDDIAWYTGSTWEFITPTEGFICWIKDENIFYNFNGAAWSQFEASSGLFDIDMNGDLEPNSDGVIDDVYELDGNSDIQPKA